MEPGVGWSRPEETGGRQLTVGDQDLAVGRQNHCWARSQGRLSLFLLGTSSEHSCWGRWSLEAAGGAGGRL